MTDEPSLRVPLGELSELPEFAPEETEVALEPIPAPEVPSDRALVRAEDLASLALSTPAGGVLHVAGALGAAPAFVVAELARSSSRPVVAVVRDTDEARHLADDVAFLLGAPQSAAVFPSHEALPWAEVAPDRRAAEARLAALFRLGSGLPPRVLSVAASALARKVVSRSAVMGASTRVREGGEIERDELAARLSAAGYVKSPLVDDPGGFAVRGSLVDVWPPTSAVPLRIELYGPLVMSIRAFDPEDQRSGDAVPEVWLPPVREALDAARDAGRVRDAIRQLCDAVDWPTAKARALADDVAADRTFFGADGFLPAFLDLEPLANHLPEGALFVLVDPAAVVGALAAELGRALEAEAGKLGEPHFPLERFFVGEAAVAAVLERSSVLALHALAVTGVGEGPLGRLESCPEDAPTLGAQPQDELARAIAQSRGERGRTRALDPLLRRLLGWQEAGYRTVLTARAKSQAERIVTLLRHRGARVRARLEPRPLLELLAETKPGEAMVVVGSLSRGLLSPVELLALVTEEDVFGARAERKAARASKREGKNARAFLEDLRSLEVGDFVVHVEHGVGRYLGLMHREVAGATVDLVALEYAGGDKLYVPVYRLSQVQKYAGGEGSPKIDRLGGQTFAKTKSRVREDVRRMADELLRLYAERKAAVGEATPPPDDEYRAFEATFPFDETADQARAIVEVSQDLEAHRPMDRLVCGDVGFGKTEVAIRAAFRVAASGRQVAVLCPTTILAQQHYLSFSARFAQTPLVVRAMSRFQPKKEQDDTLRGLKQGTVDVVIGTHRLLSKDLHFQKLGLLVVDEEQRFGVTHKERIKALKANVDVLTLSATPIPRTLQMAVTGLRDMSIITTAPADRRAIRTVVTKHDEQVIREAVLREVGRGGQVFYVYNRVEGLYEKAARLQALVPSARIAVAHGQMNETALERTMLDFVDGQYDVLCATAIIESGLDIPRANTMVIDRADLFGLAQLYQLRGRVGRSKERAYCYLVVPPVNAMTDEARARIEALERFTELGSGFQIASLDLELRGAGDLLGAEQHGTVASVGLEMFCQMLEEAVAELQGEAVVHDVDPELTVDVAALLPETYVSEVGVRLSLYKRLASASSDGEVGDLAEEMEDRFGPPPEEALRFVELMRLKTELRALRAFGCEATKKSVTVHLRQDTPLDHAAILRLVQAKGSCWRLTPDGRLTRRSREAEAWKSGLEAAGKMLSELATCRP